MTVALRGVVPVRRRLSRCWLLLLAVGGCAYSNAALQERGKELLSAIEREEQMLTARANAAAAEVLAYAKAIRAQAESLRAASEGAGDKAQKMLAEASRLFDRAREQLERARSLTAPQAATPRKPKTADELKAALELLKSEIDAGIKIAEAKKDETRKQKLEVILTVRDQAEAERAAATAGAAVNADRLGTAQVLFERAEYDLRKLDLQLLHSPWFRVHAGAATVSPYLLRRRASDGRFQLDRASGTTTFYTELGYLHRAAWLDPEQRVDQGSDSWIKPEDYEFRFRFINREGEVDSSTESANGDWSFEASLGYALWDYNLDDNHASVDELTRPRGTFNLEFNGGFDTDREALQVRGYYQAGFGAAWAIPVKLSGETVRDATVYTGLFAGIHEYPRVDADDVVYSLDARPHFNRLGTIGVKVDLTVPLARQLEAVVQGRLFSPISRTDVPDDWSLLVGVSVPVGKWVRDLFE